MDVEKTIQHLLEMQAHNEEAQARNQQAQAQNELRWAESRKQWEEFLRGDESRRAESRKQWEESQIRWEKVEKRSRAAQNRSIKTEHLITALTRVVKEETESMHQLREVQKEQGEKINILIDGQIELRQQMGEMSQKIGELTVSVKELTAAQKETDRKMAAYFDSLREGRNGH